MAIVKPSDVAPTGPLTGTEQVLDEQHKQVAERGAERSGVIAPVVGAISISETAIEPLAHEGSPEQERRDIESRWADLVGQAKAVVAADGALDDAFRAHQKNRKQRGQKRMSDSLRRDVEVLLEEDLRHEEGQLDALVEIAAFEEGMPPDHEENKGFVGGEDRDNHGLYGPSKAAKALREALAESVDRVIEGKNTDDDVEQAIVVGGHAIKEKLNDRRLTGEREPTTQEIVRDALLGAIRQYHQLERGVQATRDGVTRGGTAATDLIRQRGIVGQIQTALLMLGGDERTRVELAISAAVRNESPKDPTLKTSYEKMIRGLKLEIGSLVALQQAVEQEPVWAGWTVRPASPEEDVKGGKDMIVSMPGGSSRGIVDIGLDVKAARAFEAGVQGGKFAAIPGYEGRFALRTNQTGEQVLVVNAENHAMGGRLAFDEIKLQTKAGRSVIQQDLFELTNPAKFAGEVLAIAGRLGRSRVQGRVSK
jgi:hypothetical protein